MEEIQMKNESIWLGRTAYQIMPDRYYRSVRSSSDISENDDDPIEFCIKHELIDEATTKEKHSRKIGYRVLKDWDDRNPDWKPNESGEYLNDYFYGGNLKGIADRLSYIADLGFDMIYLTPIEESNSYHHYDVGNHMKIDPWLGTWSDFKYLCNKAKSMGIVVIVDLVFNHTGIHSVYFQNQNFF